jgi:hypothetical protein
MNHLLLAALALSTAALPCQDSLAVSWTGDVYYLDTTVPRATRLTAIPGPIGQNALALDSNGVFWSTRGTTIGSYFLTSIDPITGVATQRFPMPDIRGLTSAGNGQLFAVQEAPLPQTSDILSRIDTLTGSVTQIGPTGFTSLQGLAFVNGGLYAWDISQGLVILDPNTGLGTDVAPGVGGPTIQTLSAAVDGRLLGGGGGPNQLYAIDLSAGTTVGLGAMTGAVDIRGIESFGGSHFGFGTGCLGSFGTVTMSVRGLLTGFGNFTTTSTNHAGNAIGVQIIGFSRTTSGGMPLPLLLDPMLGTIGCRLLVSTDITRFAFTSAATPATLGFPLNLNSVAAGLLLHVQHACFEPVAGGMSFSNAAQVQIAPYW